jgi:ubiquinone/menaquinone biosynthesis C-methylase UbiE
MIKAIPEGDLVEVGAGASLLAELIADIDPGEEFWVEADDDQEELLFSDSKMPSLLITDESGPMLSYSLRWEKLGAELRVCKADQLPCRDGSVRLVVASLGDTYNSANFWAEMNRVLMPGGEVVFTSPSYQWAEASPDWQDQKARFITIAEKELWIDSFVLDPDAQIELIEDTGLTITHHFDLPLQALEGPISPRLEPLRPEDSIVSAYKAAK